MTYTVTGLVSSALMGTFSNTATISSSASDPNPGNNSATDTDTLTPQADLAVVKTGPATIIAGTDVSYNITVTNNGASDAQSVSLGDVFPAGVTFVSQNQTAGPAFTLGNTGSQITDTIGTLAAGATASFTLVGHVNASAANGSTLSNSATVSATTTDPTLGNNSGTAVTTVTTQADLSLTKTDSPDPVFVGNNLTYTLAFANNGASDAQNATITDTLPSGMTFVSASAAGGWVATTPAVGGTGTVTFTKTTSAAGETSNFTIVVAATPASAGSTISNTATTSSDTTDPTPGNNSSTAQTLVKGVDLTLTKTDNATTTTPGSTLTYVLNYANTGSADATGVVLTETLPAGTSFVSASNSGWTQIGATNQYRFTVGALAASGSGSQNFVVRVNDTVAAGLGNVVNTASLADDGTHGTDITPGNNSATDSDTLNAAPDFLLTVTKHHFTASGASIPVAETKNLIARGQELQYTYTYSNVGNQDAGLTTITAHVPTGTSFDSGHSTSGWIPSGSDYKFDLASLPAGASAGSVIFAVDVNQARTLGLKKIDSTATIGDAGANGPDLTPANNTATTSTTLYEGIYTLSNSRQGGAYGAGSLPNVRIFDVTTGVEALKLLAYETSYRAGVRIAIGDINGDGFDDIVTATRTGTGRIRVFDGLTHERINVGALSQINAFTGKQASGAYVALSDVNGDGRLDIIAGSGLGGGTMKAFNGVNASLLQTETPFGAKYKGGIRVAGGDVNGDGRGEIITGQGSLGSKVKVFFTGKGPDPIEFDGSSGTAPHLRDGVFLATGDTTGDGIAEIIIGRGRTGSSAQASVGIFHISGSTATEIKTIPLSNSTYRFGARVAATDINFDGIADIVVGAGPIGNSKVQILDGVTGNEISSLTAFSPRTLGVWTAAGAPAVPVKMK